MTEKEQGKTTSKIAGEINAEMMKTTRATQSLTDRMVQEIESLRQQLSDMTKERDKAKAMPMRYRRMEFNAQLEQQVANAIKQNVMLREAMTYEEVKE